MVTIRLYQDDDEEIWDSFVMKHPEGTIFHLIQWKNVIEKTFGHKAHYLIAEEAGNAFKASDNNHVKSSNITIVGVLPLFTVKSAIFGRYLVSVPFSELGGPIANSEIIEARLVSQAIQYTKENCLEYLEFRNMNPKAEGLSQKDLYFNFSREIYDSLEDNMKAIPRKSRRMIRQGEKNNLSFEFGLHAIDSFYDILARSYQHLGTPIFASRFFHNFYTEFGDRCNILMIFSDGRPIAGVFFFLFKNKVVPYYAGSLVQYRKLAPNDYMYWQLMKYGCENGFKIFDFGRSRADTGSFHFKRHWGFEPKSLCYQYFLNTLDDLPNLSPANPKYKKKIELWQRLPFWATKILGPPIAKYLA
ncbi:MAG: FemAB family XrtA/PEP-CTERM system-associated protein [Thermodesulfobacteriota bacterium]|nr:FemAB family XrtA/PEP-CTERM system-associated protein [Thermodesulfobacteriota bacterium]